MTEGKHGQRDRQMETDRQTDTQQFHSSDVWQANDGTHGQRQTDRHTGRETGRQTPDSFIAAMCGRQMMEHTDRDRQTDRRAERQTDRHPTVS